MNRIDILDKLLNMNLAADIEKCDHVAMMELNVARFSAMCLILEEEMNVSVMLSSTAGLAAYGPMIASISTLQDSVTT